MPLSYVLTVSYQPHMEKFSFCGRWHKYFCSRTLVVFFERIRARNRAHLFFDFIFQKKKFPNHTVGVMWQSSSTVTQLSRNMLHCFFTVQQNGFIVGRRIVIQWKTRNQNRNQVLNQSFHNTEHFDLKKSQRISFWIKSFIICQISNFQNTSFFWSLVWILPLTEDACFLEI